MTPEKQQIKSSMQFLGRIHEVYVEALKEHFDVTKNRFLSIYWDDKKCNELIVADNEIYLKEGQFEDYLAKPELLKYFCNYETAYYQLVYEISKKVVQAIDLILDKNQDINDIFVSGGFINNEVFIKYISLLKQGVRIKVSNTKNESAYGAALMIKDYL